MIDQLEKGRLYQGGFLLTNAVGEGVDADSLPTVAAVFKNRVVTAETATVTDQTSDATGSYAVVFAPLNPTAGDFYELIIESTISGSAKPHKMTFVVTEKVDHKVGPKLATDLGEASTVSVYVNPGRASLPNSIEVEVHQHVGNRLGIVHEMQTSGTNGVRSINEIKKGVANPCFYTTEVADTLGNSLTKASAGGVDYFNITNDSKYAEFDYDRPFEANRMALRGYAVTGSSGVLEVVRNRSAVLTVLAEVDMEVGETTTSYTWDIALTGGTLIDGDSIRLRRKSGETLNCRPESLVAYSSEVEPIDGQPVWVNELVSISKAGSSVEFAYLTAPDGETSDWIGNAAHQDFDEVNYSEVWTLGGATLTVPTRGGFTGTLLINRSADIDYSGLGQEFVGYAIGTRWISGGIAMEHLLTFNEDSTIATGYPLMFPAVAGATHISASHEYQLTLTDGTFLPLGTQQEAQILLPDGVTVNTFSRDPLYTTLKMDGDANGYDKLYYRNVPSSTPYLTGETIGGTGYIIYGQEWGHRIGTGEVSQDLGTNVDAILEDTGTTLPADLATINNNVTDVGVIVTTIDTNVDAILEDTGTTLPADLATINNNVTDVGVIVTTIDTNVGLILEDTNELQLNQGNWSTATGFSTHSAADVYTAMGDGSNLTASGLDSYATVVFVPTAQPDSTTVNLTQGDAYDGSAWDALQWTAPKDVDGETIEFTVRDENDDIVIDTSTDGVSASASGTTITVSLSSDATRLLDPCDMKFDVEVQFSATSNMTVANGVCSVFRDQSR